MKAACRNPDERMPVELHLAPFSARGLIESMIAPYLAELGAAGNYPHLDKYWQESSRFPYVLRNQQQVAGFALVRKVDERPSFNLVEFYIAKESRKRGLGRQAVQAIFAAHPGAWSVAVLRSNVVAQRFWAAVFDRNPSLTIVQLQSPDRTMFRLISALPGEP